MWLLFIIIAILSVAVLTLGVALFYKNLPETTHVKFEEDLITARERSSFLSTEEFKEMFAKAMRSVEDKPEKPTPPPLRKIDQW